jgi:multicomponent Na+:H+ antiporter subunit D
MFPTYQIHEYLPIILMAVPLLAGLFSPLVRRYRILYHSICIALGIINIGLLLNDHVPVTVTVIPSLLVFYFDRYSWFYVLLINLTWVITVIYSFSYTRHHFRDKMLYFYAYLSASMVAVSAAGMAGDLIAFAMFYMISIVIGYFLVTIRGNLQAYKIGKLYLQQTVLPGLLLFLPTLLYINQVTENKSFSEIPTLGLHISPEVTSTLVALIVLSVGMNSVFPFHTWLPRSWSAPAPVSVLMHTVAAVSLGPLALLKLNTYVFGRETMYDLAHDFTHTGWLLYLLGINAVYAAYKAWKTKNMKQRFAYSSVSQLSYILSAFLVSSKLAILGGLFHIASHALAKMCLFFIAGYYNMRTRTVDIPSLAPYMPHTKPMAVMVTLCGMSIIGFPLLAGFQSKDLILLEEIHSHHYLPAIFLLIGSFINILYIYPIVISAFFAKKNPDIMIAPPPKSMQLAMFLCIAIILTFSLFVPFLVEYLE